MKGSEPNLGSFRAVFGPSLRGVKIAKIAIVLECGLQSLRPLGTLSRYVLPWGLHPSRTGASTFAMSANVDVSPPLFYSILGMFIFIF